MSAPQRIFKMIVVGDSGVGKSSFLERLVPSLHEPTYISDLPYKTCDIYVDTIYGQMIFNAYDPSGHENFGSLTDRFYQDSHCAIIMFDVTNKDSYKHVDNWYRDIMRICPDIPIILLGNKVDIRERTVNRKTITFHCRHPNVKYLEISVKTNFHLMKPLHSLITTLTGFQIEGHTPTPEEEPKRIVIPEGSDF